MVRRVFYFVAPLLSLVFATLGNGLFTTVLTLRMHQQGDSSLLIGLMVGAYYAGMVIAAFRSERFIARVGHIRAYAAIASLLAIVSLLQGIIETAWLALVLRFISGACMAGIYIVIESWLLASSSAIVRGRVLAIYMVALYGAQASGQFLLNLSDPMSVMPFCIIAILSSLSVLPVAMTYIRSPKIDAPSTLSLRKLYRASPAGTLSSFTSGLILGPIYGLMPLYASQLNYPASDVALVMSMVIYGGMLLQYPVGRSSDYLGRRKVLIFLSLATAITALMLFCFALYYRWAFLVAAFLFGGFSFTLYPVSISFACDMLNKKDIVAATQGILLAYGVGASVGPIIAPLFIHYLGVQGLQIYFMIIASLLAVYLSWNKYHKVITHLVHRPFVVMPRGTPVASQLDPRAKGK